MAGDGAGVARGRDGWLFWVGRAGELEALYADTAASRRLLERWARLVESRTRRLDRLGIASLHLVVPEKLAVHGDALDRAFPGLDDPPCARLARRLAGGARPPGAGSGGYVDLLAPLRAARGEGPVYLRTDTHWTHRGYLAAYREICHALGAPPAAHVLAGRTRPDRFTFDLGEKLDPPVEEAYAVHLFERGARRVEANALVHVREGGMAVRRGGLFVGSRAVLRNPEPLDPRRVVLFGDSYVHDPGPRLTAMLGETFAEVHAIWSADIDWAYVERVAPDVLVFEIAERFLRRVPVDRFRTDAFAAARARRAVRPTLRERVRGWLHGRSVRGR